jgi:GT2 family glycosyltransferase
MGTSAQSKPAPRAAVIIPSRDGYRDGMVPRLLESIARQSFTDYAIHIVEGVYPQGRAINQGVGATHGEIILLLDDDSRILDSDVFERLVAALDADPTIGMAGASIVAPPEATGFQRRAARQFPRFNVPEVDAVTDSDLACHGCCAIPRAVFEAIGGEREDLVRGLDPDLRVRLREAGYRVVLVPHARVAHPLPDGWRALARVFFRNGRGSAFARRYQPDSVFETHEELDGRQFRPRTSLKWRLVRFPARLVLALCRGRLIRFTAYACYACGYVWGWLTPGEKTLARG